MGTKVSQGDVLNAIMKQFSCKSNLLEAEPYCIKTDQ